MPYLFGSDAMCSKIPLFLMLTSNKIYILPIEPPDLNCALSVTWLASAPSSIIFTSIRTDRLEIWWIG